MEKIPEIHPGDILKEEFMEPVNLTAYKLAKGLHIDQTRVSEILKGKRGISIDTALRLSRFFGNSAQYWLNIQNHFDIEKKSAEMEKELLEIEQYEINAV